MARLQLLSVGATWRWPYSLVPMTWVDPEHKATCITFACEAFIGKNELQKESPGIRHIFSATVQLSIGAHPCICNAEPSTFQNDHELDIHSNKIDGF